MIEIRTLADGAQAPVEIARLLASFLERAEETLDIAIYDINLADETEQIVLGTLRSAASRGVRVRLLYNVDDRPPGDVLPPPPPKTRPEEIEALPIATCGIPGWPDLMHHKYVVRDRAAVWTGSTNWTEDSWSREENVIAVVDSDPIGQRYSQDFEQLWRTKLVRRSGKVSPAAVDGVRAWFSPKRGEWLAHRIAHAIARAERRVRIASPIITSGPILGTLADVVADGEVDLAGVVDNTQVNEVLAQWAANPVKTWKARALRTTLSAAPFSGKPSTPYAPGTVHDYMHAKVTVCDDTLFVGSFNLSHSGESNAENVLEIEDPALAERMTRFVDEVRGRYPAVELT
jgi:phosphatidylserine/phosphatidylglycerophosphate/cardiolipin synthase-like enzyme